MPCYSLQIAFPTPGRTKTGKQAYHFAGKLSTYLLNGTFKKIQKPLAKGFKLLPCRQCIGCRLEKSRQWAIRLLHEIPFHHGATFITLTYDDKHLPKNMSLVKSDLRKFFNDLRSRNSYYGKAKIKYFACGEYGDQTGRPHYHAALYGPISVHQRTSSLHPEEPSRSGAPQFTHDDIAATWGHGLHRISDLSFESAAYVARYVLKKISGLSAPAHYGARIPEFQSPSNGLGRAHHETWFDDIYPGDQVVLPGRGSFLPPPYYDRLLEKADPALFARVKQKRQEAQETLSSREELVELYTELSMQGKVRQLVTDETLIRGTL